MRRRHADVFEGTEPTPRDMIFATAAAYQNCKHSDKVNLGMGVFKTDEGHSVVLSCVKRAEAAYVDLIASGKEFKDYDLSAGFRPFVLESCKLLYGPMMPPQREWDRIVGCVTLSGTGALRVAAEMLQKFLPTDQTRDVLIPDPSWPPHFSIFSNLGFKTKTYPYFSQKMRGIDFDATVAFLRSAEQHSIIVLQLVGHNPTGADFSHEQWDVVCDIVKEKSLIPVVDSAYQGFATGDLDHDAYAVRLFAMRGVQVLACQSYAKNMGLYGDRLGCFSVICKDRKTAAATQSRLNSDVVRPMYSSPPRAPARIAHMILTDPALRKMWEGEVRQMAERIGRTRVLLRAELERLGTPAGDGTGFGFIVDQVGMFSYLCLTPEQCRRMQQEFHIFLLPTSRISMSGVRSSNVRRIAEAIDAVVRGLPAADLDRGPSLQNIPLPKVMQEAKKRKEALKEKIMAQATQSKL